MFVVVLFRAKVEAITSFLKVFVADPAALNIASSSLPHEPSLFHRILNFQLANPVLVMSPEIWELLCEDLDGFLADTHELLEL